MSNEDTSTSPKPFVFVLMPFEEGFKEIYQLGIKEACREAGAYCERVDEQIFAESILERIYNQIAKADIIVADMSGRNANVFYETGYAHALNKQVILLTQSADDIPFDLKHYPHIVYGGKIIPLKSELERKIRWCVENPKAQLSKADLNIEVFVNGKPLVDSQEIPGVYNGESNFYPYELGELYRSLKLTIGFHNSTPHVLEYETCHFALILPEYCRAESYNLTHLPDGRRLCNLHVRAPIFPDGWISEEITVYAKASKIDASPHDSLLRLYTAVGPRDYPFKLSLHPYERTESLKNT